MPADVLIRHLDPTPPRPSTTLQTPPNQVCFRVEIEAAHLANPLIAVQRLLASEAVAFAHVSGDDDQLDIRLALGENTESERRRAEAWVRWATHCAGIRGRITDLTDVTARRPPGRR